MLPSSDYELVQYIPTSPETAKRAQDLRVNGNVDYDYFGVPVNLDDLPASIKDWAQRHVTGDLITPLLGFLRYTHEHYINPEKHFTAYYLNIRLYKATDDPKTQSPRWHRDGRLFSSVSGGPGVFTSATTLNGAGTLFQVEGDKARHILEADLAAKGKIWNEMLRLLGAMKVESMREKLFSTYGEESRVRVAKKLKRMPVAEAGPGQLSIWRHSDKPELPAVHAEPVEHGDRIFFSVVPGTNNQIWHLARERQVRFVTAAAPLSSPLSILEALADDALDELRLKTRHQDLAAGSGGVPGKVTQGVSHHNGGRGPAVTDTNRSSFKGGNGNQNKGPTPGGVNTIEIGERRKHVDTQKDFFKPSAIEEMVARKNADGKKGAGKKHIKTKRDGKGDGGQSTTADRVHPSTTTSVSPNNKTSVQTTKSDKNVPPPVQPSSAATAKAGKKRKHHGVEHAGEGMTSGAVHPVGRELMDQQPAKKKKKKS